MNPIVDIADVPRLFPAVHCAEAWTAVIPAAGRGTRLAYGRPKVLFPVLGKPILQWLVDLLSPLCGSLVFVLSEDGAELCRPLLTPQAPAQHKIVLQRVPLGMGHAVRQAREEVHTPHTLVVWGDQVTLHRRTVEACLRAHQGRPVARLTFPTTLRPNPYIHLERDPAGRILKVRQAREESLRVELGENDCGLFLFNSAALFAGLECGEREGWALGTVTGELNLLPLIPALDEGGGTVLTIRITNADETLGVNTREEAEAAERILAARLGSD